MTSISNNGIVFAQATLSKINNSANTITTIVDADQFVCQDSANNYSVSKVSANSVYNYLKPRFDSVYANSSILNYTSGFANNVVRTIANRLSDAISVKDFGAVGDGITDDSLAIQNAFQYGADTNNQILIPSGMYLLNSQVNIIINQGKRTYVNILGTGQFTSMFILGKANYSGAIKITSNSNNYDIEVKNIGFGSLLNQYTEISPTNGVALWIHSNIYGSPNNISNNTNGFGVNPTNSVIVDNIFIGGYSLNNFNTTGSWSKGIQLDNIWFPTIKNCYVSGIQTVGSGFGYNKGDVLTFDLDAYANSPFYTPGLETGSGFKVLVTDTDSINGITSSNSNYSSTTNNYTQGTYLNVPMKYISANGMLSGNNAYYSVMFRNDSINGLNPNYCYSVLNNAGPNMPKGQNIAGIHLWGCYSPFIESCKVQGYFDYSVWHQGVVSQGNSEQGGSLSNCMLVNGDIGFAITHLNNVVPNPAHPGFQIVNSHFNSHSYGIYLDKHREIFISNCYFFVASPNKIILKKTSSIYLANVSEVLITNCGFYGQGFYCSNTIYSSAITISSSVTGGVIMNNLSIPAGGVGILNDCNNSSYLYSWTTNGQKVSNLDAQYIPILDNTGSFTSIGSTYASQNSLSDRGKDITYSYSTDTAINTPNKILASYRSDYATNINAQLGAYSFNAYNSSGIDTQVGSFTAKWSNNTTKFESSVLNINAKNNGSIISLISFDGANKRVNIPSQSQISFSATSSISSNNIIPYGNIDAQLGSIYLNSVGGSGNSLWIKESSGNTGWTAINSYKLAVTKVTNGNYNILLTDDIILASGNSVLTLPDPTFFNKRYTIKNINIANNNTIVITSANPIDFSSSNVNITTALSSINLISDGNKWFKV